MRPYISVFCVILCAILDDVFMRVLPPEYPTVETVSGLVVGSVARDGDYYEYLGIPYADSTSGSHRFKAPVPPPHFTEPFIASRRNIKCVRAIGAGYEGTEDCLVVNVYTPTLDDTKELPVMVWIKGREFDQTHDQELSFKQFVEKDIVVVTLNYRESILGFLCLGTETAPGNAGLKDIIAGLRWVKENIAAFGGNPDDVTLFGHGTGAAAVDLVTISPMAEGLVNKAILQSGNALAPWAVSRDNLHYAVKVAEALGHIFTDVEDLSLLFSRTSVPALMAVINELDLTDNSLAFSPCMEREDLEGETPFMIKSPFEIISKGEFLQIPIITGFVDNEGTIRSEELIESSWLHKMANSFTDFLQSDLKFESNEEREEVAHNIKTFYFDDEEINMHNINEYIAYHGDTMILVSSIRESRLRATSSTAPIYLYQFSYKGSLGESFEGPIPVESAGHSEELGYLFPELQTTDYISEMDLTVADILVERWTNFAKDGIPTSESSQIEWLPFTAENPHYLRVLNRDEISESAGTLEVDLINPHVEKVNFWNSIYEDHFLDAESKWEITTDAGDDYDELIFNQGFPRNGTEGSEEGSGEEGSGEEEGDEDGSGEEGSGEEGSGDEDEECDEDTDGDCDSAATAAAYTFSIIFLFAILDKIHSIVVLS